MSARIAPSYAYRQARRDEQRENMRQIKMLKERVARLERLVGSGGYVPGSMTYVGLPED